MLVSVDFVDVQLSIEFIKKLLNNKILRTAKKKINAIMDVVFRYDGVVKILSLIKLLTAG